MITDPIADCLTRIRNAQRTGKKSARVRSSRMIKNILQVLKDEGFILNFELVPEGESKFEEIEVGLKYYSNGEPALQTLRRISSPGRRVYSRNSDLPRVFQGLGLAVLSTSQGLMTDTEARKRKIGGEVLAFIARTMSRIGKLAVKVPAGVNASVSGNTVSVEGPRGKLKYQHGIGVDVEQADGELVVRRQEARNHREGKQFNANYGTTRAHIQNMVKGVTDGYKRSLEMSGVGFTAKLQGEDLVLAAGYSHDVVLKIPASIKVQVGKQQIDLESPSKEDIGTFAAKIRKVHPPEPYLGKGIKYSDEQIRRKAGKAGK